MTSISVPVEAVKKASGFSLDFGSSVLKTAVVVKVKANGETWRPGDREENIKSAHLLLKSFPRENTEPLQGCVAATRAMIAYIKGKDVLQKEGDRAEVHSLGIATGLHKAEMEKEFNISLVNGNEIACLVKAFVELHKHLSHEDLFWPVPTHVQDQGNKEAEKTFNTIQLWVGKPAGSQMAKLCSQFPGKERFPVAKPAGGATRSMFPCVLMNAGSAGLILLMMEDGSFHLPLCNPQCGLTVLGLGSLLLGVHTYSELLSLAEKGEEGQVTTSFKDLVAGTKGDIYDNTKMPGPVFTFGKAHKKQTSDFKKEDMARAILHANVTQLVDMTRLMALQYGAKSVLFSGGLFNSQLSRDLAATRFYQTEAWAADICKGLDLFFPKYGNFYGAIGGVFMNSESLSA